MGKDGDEMSGNTKHVLVLHGGPRAFLCRFPQDLSLILLTSQTVLIRAFSFLMQGGFRGDMVLRCIQ